jgi:hypothetical protein
MLSRPITPEYINSIKNSVIEDSNSNDLIKLNTKINSSSNKVTDKNLETRKLIELRELLKYYKSIISFSKNKNYNAIQLKYLKSKYDFSLKGKKEELVNRLKAILLKEKSTILLQKTFRRFILMKELIMRGPALKNRKLCVNDTDFYTLEPLKDIELGSFFSYEGSGNFIYGFDLNSLLTLFKNSKIDKFVNPYNRESMSSIMFTIQDLARITAINRRDNKIMINPIKSNIPRSEQNLMFHINSRISNLVGGINYNAEHAIEEIRKARSKTLTHRINDLFNEIDQLGNYTQAEWFSRLNAQELIRFFRCLYDIWNYRGQLSFQIKIKICPLFDPFSNGLQSINRILDLSESQVRVLCLSVMESMVLTGIDSDHKMIGTLHVLTALTVVSSQARENLPWLYESLALL